MNTQTGCHEAFSVKKAFVSKLNFYIPKALLTLMTPSDSTKVDSITTRVRSIETTVPSEYFVDIDIDIKSSVNESYIKHSLSLNYLACVVIHDKNLKKKSIQRILNFIVPQYLFNEINSIVFNTTNLTHYPIILDKDTFVGSIKDKGITRIQIDEKTDADESAIVPIGETVDYRWIINRISSYEGFDELLSKYKLCTGNNMTDDYETQPAYKYYCRFFVPIQYSHPDFEVCAESVWAMLFQLLFSNFNTTCKVIDMKEGLPEIEFSRDGFQNVKISELSLKELLDLLDSLLLDMFGDFTVCFADFKNINKQQLETIRTDRLIRRSDFFKLYGFDDIELIPKKELEQLEKLYGRIKKCDLQTRIYRHQSEQKPDFDSAFF